MHHATTTAYRAERNARYSCASCTPVQTLVRVLSNALRSTMKHGKYDLHKTSANVSVGTSYSWYYRKNDNSTRKKKRLTRSASDSTLFSDYANQISLFENENAQRKKCKKSVSDVGKHTRVKYNPRAIKPVHMEPFVGNFFYGKSLPGYENTKKTEEKITYLPDSDVVTPSEGTATESITTNAPTIIDIPEMVKNPLYGCKNSDIHLSTPEYFSESVTSNNTQFQSSSCTELRNTMCTSKDPEDVLSKILKDYKRIMKEWNHTVKDHCSSVSRCNKRGSIINGSSNSESYMRSSGSSLSCRKPTKCLKSLNSYNHYSYAYASRYGHKKFENNVESQSKTQSLKRNLSLSNWASTLQNLKRKSKFWKLNESLTPSECKCLEAIYRDYDRRLEAWCDTVSVCSSLLTSVLVKSCKAYLVFEPNFDYALLIYEYILLTYYTCIIVNLDSTWSNYRSTSMSIYELSCSM